MKTKFLSLLLIIVFFISSFKVSAQAVNVQDSLALVDLYNSTNGGDWLNHTNWLTTSPASSWYGVTVENDRVIRIALNGNKLIGSIPSSIGNMSALNVLSLEHNQLSGTLPASIGNMPAIYFFSIAYNDVSGDIPSSFTNFMRGSTLVFTNNRFTFSGMEALLNAAGTKGFIFMYFPQGDITLNRNGNILSVSVGGTLSKNTYQWYKDGAAFVSKIGDSTLTISSDAHYSVEVNNNILSQLTLYSIDTTNIQDSLALVDLYNNTNGTGWVNNNNWLSATPVNKWDGITVRRGRVTRLLLSYNNLNGTLPATIGNLIGLKEMDLNSNKLSGNIPATITNLNNLQTLYLSTNQLTGTIPTDIGNLIVLTGVAFTSNQLTGSIPASLGNIWGLTSIQLGNNQLTGTIPDALGNLPNLSSLYANDNQLTGSLPSSLGRATNLTLFEFGNNQLTGSIPDSFAYLVKLNRLELFNNKLTGNLPAFLNNLPQLFDLQVQNNQLSGTIPSFSNLHLSTLNISNNKFTFAGMESLPAVPSSKIYAPQANIPFTRQHELLSVSAGGTLANDTFRLYRNGTLTATQIGDSVFTITNTGNYSIKVTNTVATQLTLFSDTLVLTTLLADSGTTVTQFITGTSPIDINDGIFKLVTITPTSGANALTGNVTATVAIDTAVRVYRNMPYVQRHYDITPAVNPSTAQATVTLYFTQQDFDNFNNYVTANNLGLPLMPTGGINNGNIHIMQLHGSFTATPDPGNFADSTIIIIIPTVTWDNTNNWWIVTFPVTGFSGFFLTTGTLIALPLNLIDFNGKLYNNSVRLQWVTANERDTKKFIIERGSNGNSFKDIGEIIAQTMQSSNNYSFTDANPLNGNNFYRLRIINVDGKISYSNIFTIKISAVGKISIYPNPVNELCTLSFNSAAPGKYYLNILDKSGKIIKKMDGVSIAGINKITIDMQGYAGGSYFIKLITGETESNILKLNKR